MIDPAALRAEFLRLLTTDSPPGMDRRHRDHNQAIFDGQRGYAIWTSTDLHMVMEKFDKAVRTVPRADDYEAGVQHGMDIATLAHWENDRG